MGRNLEYCFSFLVAEEDVYRIETYLAGPGNTFASLREEMDGLGHSPDFISSLNPAQGKLFDANPVLEIHRVGQDGEYQRVHLKPRDGSIFYSRAEFDLLMHRVFVENRDIIHVPRFNKP